MDLYLKNAFAISKATTNHYSTSFSLGVRLLSKKYQDPIYAIYGFVRFADEIVDTFHDADQKKLLDGFRAQTFDAIQSGISTNPILHSFQKVANEYTIGADLIDAFLDSMEMDLYNSRYNPENFKKYIYGSAEVVGLMCLKVFYKNNPEKYDSLKYYARKLGEAFQKVNFLRDIQADFVERGRLYFPGVDFNNLSLDDKIKIEQEIEYDFKEAFKGIVLLHGGVKLGVYISFKYYQKLFNKIRFAQPKQLLKQRYRISNATKMRILATSSVRYALNIFD
jgi:15-cis-phytoene synthase